jgi:oligosaccharide repeat unit polymerase
VCYLTGFALFAPKAEASTTYWRASVATWRFLVLIGFCFGVFVLFIEMNGGLITHFSRLAYGRFLMSESEGHFLLIISLLPYLLALWYAARPKNLRGVWFIALFVPALFTQFATTGSRSSIVAPVILLLALWMLINRKAPALRIVLLGFFVTTFLGTLAELRSSAGRNAGVVDLSVLKGIDVVSGTQSTIEHRARLDEASGLIAVMYAVPERVPYLYGVTYLSSVAFFVPRTIWPEKPRGPGAHVGAIIYGDATSTEGYTGTSIPAGGVGEAYWNFGVLGVVFVYLAFGLFYRFIARYYMSRPNDPFRAVVFLMSMVVLLDASSDALVRYLQLLVLLYVSWLFVRRVKARRLNAVSLISGTMTEAVAASGRR